MSSYRMAETMSAVMTSMAAFNSQGTVPATMVVQIMAVGTSSNSSSSLMAAEITGDRNMANSKATNRPTTNNNTTVDSRAMVDKTNAMIATTHTDGEAIVDTVHRRVSMMMIDMNAVVGRWFSSATWAAE